MAVPEAWLDIATIADLADLAVEFKASGRELRIATAYPNLARAFLYRHGVNYFVLTGAHGAPEAGRRWATPISSSRSPRPARPCATTGSSSSKAAASCARRCLIGNQQALAASEEKRQMLRGIMELIEARLRAATCRITANIRGDTEAEVARHVVAQMETAGAQGPTISRLHTSKRHWATPGSP